MQVDILSRKCDTPVMEGSNLYYRESNTRRLVICQEFVGKFLNGKLPNYILIRLSTQLFKGCHKAHTTDGRRIFIESLLLSRKLRRDWYKHTCPREFHMSSILENALNKLEVEQYTTFYWDISEVSPDGLY